MAATVAVTTMEPALKVRVTCSVGTPIARARFVWKPTASNVSIVVSSVNVCTTTCCRGMGGGGGDGGGGLKTTFGMYGGSGGGGE
jgi:hypothetical protein